VGGGTNSSGYVNADSLVEGGIGKASANDSADDANGGTTCWSAGASGLRIGFEGLTQVEIGTNAKLEGDLSS
jgi:hypothetical protein